MTKDAVVIPFRFSARTRRGKETLATPCQVVDMEKHRASARRQAAIRPTARPFTLYPK